MKPKTVTVHDKMQRNYRYQRTEPAGRNFDPEFKPQLTPKEMLEMGIFGGKYMTDCKKEFPKSWFANAKLSPKGTKIVCGLAQVASTLFGTTTAPWPCLASGV